MRRSRKFILIGLLAVVVLAGSIGGVALAQTGNGDDTQPGTQYIAILERVSEIYKEKTGVTIDPQELQNAFIQAGQERMTEARNQFRQRLIDEGQITQEQLDEFDAWLESKPDIPLPFGKGGPGGMKPFGGFGRFGGGFHGWCQPQPSEPQPTE